MKSLTFKGVLALLVVALATSALWGQGFRRGSGPGGRGGGPGGRGGVSRLDASGLKVGSPMPEVTVFDEDGKPFETASLKGKYSVVVFGCLT